MGDSDETTPATAAAPEDPPAPAELLPEAEGLLPRGRPKKKRRRLAEPDTFARYLAQRLVADKGYHRGAVAEIAELAAVSDLVLTRSTPGGFTIVAILDAEGDPARVFALETDRLVVMALRCTPYTGGAEGLVAVYLVEVRGAIRPEDQRRLERYGQESRMTALASAEVRVGILAPPARALWSTFGWLEARWYQQVLTGPRRDAEDLVPGSPAPVPFKPDAAAAGLPAPPPATPWLTGTILALTVLVFGAEGLAGVGNSPEPRVPTVDTLVAMGGVSWDLVVGQGQWWRLFTGTLLHAGVAHLLLNGVCLFLGGVVLETLFGRAWLGAIFVLGALGGSLASIAVNDPNMVSVGASGAIMGLLAAALVASYRVPLAQRPQLQVTLARVLVPSLLPIVTSRTGEHIDFAAHAGGAAVGAALGLLLLATWPPALRLPRFRRAATALAIGGAGLYIAGFFVAAKAYAGYRDAAAVALVPNDRRDSIKPANAEALLASYPRDPRARWAAAVKAASGGDLPTAERHLRAALAEDAVLRRSFPDRQVEASLRGVLAQVLEAQGRHEDARAAARPACDVGARELEAFCR